MAKKSKKRSRGKVDPGPATTGSRETQTAEAATVAWTVTVTMVVVCDLAAIVAHLVVMQRPESKGAALFGNLMLFGGAVIGLISLFLLPVVYRLRRSPPPTGFTVFAACAAVAPILALVARSLD